MATVWFTNLSSGAAQSVPFKLEINPLLQNGGFESGSLADWQLSGNYGDSRVIGNYNGIGGIPNSAHSGNFSAFLGMNNSVGYLSQSMATVPGQSYLLSLFLNSTSGVGSSNELAISWDDITLFDYKSFATAGWTNLQFIVWAATDSTELEFSFDNATNYFILDDVSLSNLPPTLSIASQPVSQIIPAGVNAVFSVLVGGPPPFTYQWQENGTNLLVGGNISGSATATLFVSNAVVADGGNYTVVVSSGSQSVTSLVATLTVTGISPNCAVSAPKGLISWWTGNYTANDLVGSNNGILENGVTYAPGEVGYAFSFNGISGWIDVTNEAPLNPTGPFSVEYWINANPTQSDSYFLVVDHSHGFTDNSGWLMQGITASGTVMFGFGNGAGFSTAATVSSILDNQWHHLAGVFTGM
jgi:hypothetical protein